MARSIDEIQAEILAEKENRSALDELSSDSKLAIWRLWVYITSIVIYTHEVLWDIFKADVEKIVSEAAVGTPQWLRRQVLAFQYGDDLEYIDNKYQYDEIDEAAKIVKGCSINERSNGTIFIKVAKDDGNGGLMKLTNTERDALTSYVNKVKFAGMKTAVFTNDPDALTINFDLYYDPIIPLGDTLLPAIEIAINNYLSDMGFDGILNVNRFIDALQAVEGVVDPVFTYGKSVAFGSADEIEFTIENQPGAGYYQLADTIGNMFNFIPKV